MPKGTGKKSLRGRNPTCPVCKNRVTALLVTAVAGKRFVGCNRCWEAAELKAGVEQGKLFDDNK